jgi:hypothetical protein
MILISDRKGSDIDVPPVREQRLAIDAETRSHVFRSGDLSRDTDGLS